MDSTHTLGLFGFLVACYLAASTGALFRPGTWYDGLVKPSWNPPKWVFPVAWTALYTMIAVPVWLVWRQAGFAGAPLAMLLWFVQLALNAAWPWIFFGMKRMDLAFVELLALWLAILATILAFVPHSAAAAWLMLPYLAWVTFAGMLNLAIWRLNRARIAAGAG